MRIAATYENGSIFQHFGRTEQFKIYDVEDNKVVSSTIIGNNGIGHGALAGLLADNTIDVLICGGLGGGAMNALMNAGITVVAGAEGEGENLFLPELTVTIMATEKDTSAVITAMRMRAAAVVITTMKKSAAEAAAAAAACLSWSWTEKMPAGM